MTGPKNSIIAPPDLAHFCLQANADQSKQILLNGSENEPKL
ncbi:MAG TPA: hypothetical protein VF020_15915 [Chthoniobacterales bacterium]